MSLQDAKGAHEGEQMRRENRKSVERRLRRERNVTYRQMETRTCSSV